MMIVLGIESTCDETACAIVENGDKIFSNIVASQTDLHEIYGGVVPELACRRHAEVIIPMIRQALEEAHLSLKEIDLIAVAKGPGLIGALLIGLNTAKALALASEKPFIGINHIEAHLYASIMSQPQEIAFPCLGLVISGGHTSLVDVQSIGKYRLVGQTTDDAVGEAFDKVAQLLSLPYPGGPRIEALALAGDPHRYPFKAGVVKGKPLDFSFSGLKTSVMYAIKGQSSSKTAPLIIQEEDKKDVAASFQHVALSDIVKKAVLAAEQLGSKAILVGGGVSCNKYLRKLFTHAGLSIPIYWPSQGLSLDNAAMIAGLAFHKYQLHPKGDDLSLEAATRLPF